MSGTNEFEKALIEISTMLARLVPSVERQGLDIQSIDKRLSVLEITQENKSTRDEKEYDYVTEQLGLGAKEFERLRTLAELNEKDMRDLKDWRKNTLNHEEKILDRGSDHRWSIAHIIITSILAIFTSIITFLIVRPIGGK